MAVGRISGPLLKANLLRDGVDIAFETDLLYLDVNNQRIGVKNGIALNGSANLPTHELQVTGTTRTTDLIVDNRADIGDITVDGNTISTTNKYLNLGTLDNVIYQNKLRIDSIDIAGNVISTNESNANLELKPNGTGSVDVLGNMNVDGNIHATGNITADGNITLGDSDTDNVIINADVASDIIPDLNDTYNLGSDPSTGGKQWKDLWVNNITASSVNSSALSVDGIDLTLRPGNIFYVSVNGNDTNSGDHPLDPYLTIQKAISVATSGDTILVIPGVYEEVFPIEVPVGVTVKGTDLRGVTISPTVETRYNDAFLLNGGSTVEDLTVKDFYSGGNYFEVTDASSGSLTVNVGTSPFAHTYVSGGTLSGAGIGDQTVTGATYDHTTGELVIAHSGATATVGPDVFISGLIFSCNGGNRTFPDNGYAFRFATDFEVSTSTSTRSPYIKNVSVITRGSNTGVGDLLGFDSGDAGKGAYVDGAYATTNSNEASMLFHSCTFITPGVDALTATNGARIEWLNCFTYFANRSIYAYDSNDGLKGTGQTALRVGDVTGSFSAGETVTYYDTDGTTVLATGTIASKDADEKFYISGKQTAFETAEQRGGKTITANGDAQLSTAVKKFGTASLALDGTGDYASITSQDDFGFSTGDFTVEGWVYLDNLVGTQQVFDFRAGIGTDIASTVYVSNGGQIRYYTDSADRITGSTLSSATWYHVALVRESGNTKLYVNGTQAGSTYVDANDYGTAKPLTIGSRYDGGNEFHGYLDDIRVIKGVAVTPPSGGPTTRALVTPETVLMARFDGADASTTFEDDVVYTQDVRFSGGATATAITLTDFTDFGAEIRMIGSASVYGNYGLVGDGAGVIVYAIGQNLAYIGNGKESTNDPNTVIQANEVVETNGAKIRYNSVDHKGDFRVGDLFYVNQQDGTINFSVSDFNIDATNGITINSGGSSTFIDGTKIETGDWRISGNTLETLTQDAELTAASGQINLNSNVNITGNLDVTGNITIGGNLTIGDETTDTIQIVAGIDSSLIPNQTSTYDLGSPTKLWRTLYGSLISVDDIEINDNYIQTTVTNSSLELRANGTGEIVIPTNDASIAQDLYVLGNANLSNTNITGTVTHIGDYTQTGTFDITGVLNVTDELIVEGQAQFEDILINDNYITTTASNANLELRANGTGEVLIPSNNVTLNENLTVTGLASFTNISSSGTITANSFSTGDILIDDNFITTTLSNSNLELRASGTGEVLIPTNDVVIDQNLNVAGVTTFNNDTNINGSITQTGDTTQTGDFTLDGLMTVTGEMTVSGNGQFEDILITGNVLTTTLSNSDLELRASGTGEVVIPSNDVIINQDLTILGTASFNTLSATGTIVADSFSTGDILIDNNVITTTQTNSNLELVASGTGEILIPENDVNIVQNLNVDGDTTLSNTIVNGSITHIGNTTQTGNTEIAGNFTTTGTLEVSSDAQFEDIKIANNVITTTLTNSDLELRANGTGIISIPNNDLIVGGDLTVGGTLTLTQLSVSSTIIAPTFDTGDITISQNVITTNNSNSNLELRANGSGEILIPNNDVVIDQNLTVNQNTTLADTTVNGSITHTGNTTQTGNISLTGNMTISGVTTVSGQAQLEEILINDNYITTTSSNADLELRANGTGNILIPNNNVVINNDVVINGDLFASDLTNLGVVSANSYSTGDILIDDNYITTTLSNSNLELRSNGTGSILIDNIDINNSTISSTTGDMTLSPATGYLIIDGTGALKIPTGTSLDRPNTPVAGQLRYNTDLQRFEGYNGTAWISLQGLQDLDGNTKITAELTDGANDDTIRFYTGGNLVADLDINRFNVNKLVLSEITIDNNTISTTSANTDLNLSGNGTGNVIIENLSFDGNSVTNTVADAVTTFQSSGTGYFKVSGNAGLVIPSGDNLTKPDPLDSETGMLRYNTQDGRVEVFNGAAWVSVAGTSGSISTIDAENLAIEYVIVLG